MKGKAKSFGMFFAGAVVGLVIGAATTYKVASQPYQNYLADAAVSEVMWQTANATRIKQGEQTEVVKRIEMSLPNNVLMIHHQYKNHPMANQALQNIKFYYQKNNIPILSGLPK